MTAAEQQQTPVVQLTAVAHALAGPLITARGILNRAAARHPSDPELPIAVEALGRLTSVLDGLARLAATERVPLPVDVPLDDALRTAMRRTASVAPAPALRASALPAVHADEDHVTAVLTELLTNAALHAGPAPRVAVEAREETGRVVLTLADDGPGLPAAVDATRPAAFSPGSPGATAGVGCGLAVAVALAERNGGRLRLHGDGGGLRAELTLPAAREER